MIDADALLTAIGGAAAGGMGAYYAAKEAISVATARLEERVSALRKDLDSDHGRLENLANEVLRGSRGKSGAD